MNWFSSIQWGAIADKIDSLFASGARPYATYVCATAIAGACFNPTSAPIALPLAAALVGGNIAARTVEKTKAMTAANEAKKIDATAQGGPAQ